MLYWPRAGRGATAGKGAFWLVTAGIALAALILASPADAASRHGKHHRSSKATHTISQPTDPAKDAALIIDGRTGKVLFSRNASATRYPASLTKLMTLYLLFDALKKGEVTMQTPLKVSAHAAAQSPTKLYLKPGDTIPVETAIKALVVVSANDVAVTIAENLGGTELHFAGMMTAKAHELGMMHTNYHNASGLPDKRQLTTAEDLATLARHVAYDFPQYYPYFGIAGMTYHGRYYKTHDHLIGSYEGADGMKTGFTNASGFNLVSSVVRDGAHIIGVVMGGYTARSRDGEMIKLLNKTFARIEDQPTLVARNTVPWQNVARGLHNNPVVAGFDIGSATSALRRNAANTNIPVPQPAARRVASLDTGDGVPTPDLRAEALGQGDIDDSADTVAQDVSGPRNWVIQIGAYANTRMAQSGLSAYSHAARDLLGDAKPIVVPFQAADGHTLYRARFGTFAEREARNVCAKLTQRGKMCFATAVN
jgi:D-alanyl-D-alanine carboxypeptidase